MRCHRLMSLWHAPSRSMIVAVACSVLVAACATRTPPEQKTHSYLDMRTGITVTALETAMVLAHNEARRSNTLRDYLYLGPVEMNVMGKRSYYLWVSPFSTLDRPREPINEPIDELILSIDGETETLNFPPNETLVSRMETAPYSLPLDKSEGYYVAIPPALLVRLATAQEITIDTRHGTEIRRYSPWRGQPADFSGFVAALNLWATND